MRINVYGEEITNEVEIIRQRDNKDKVFYGVRFYLESPGSLSRTPPDDDRSAVTFWIPQAPSGKHQVNWFHSIFETATAKIEELKKTMIEGWSDDRR